VMAVVRRNSVRAKLHENLMIVLPTPVSVARRVHRQSRLGGLLNFDWRAA